jgi:hypothetical protein
MIKNRLKIIEEKKSCLKLENCILRLGILYSLSSFIFINSSYGIVTFESCEIENYDSNEDINSEIVKIQNANIVEILNVSLTNISNNCKSGLFSVIGTCTLFFIKNSCFKNCFGYY